MAAISFRLCPANLYGPGDRFDPAAGHVVPGLLRRTHEAKTTGAPELTIWGTGRALLEFMHVDDCADALVFLMRNYSEEHLINVGTVSIGELAKKVSEVVGYSGCFIFDTSKPDGMPRKLLDSSRMLKTGWRARNALDDGLAQTYQWFLAHELMADSTRHYAAH